MNGKRTSKLGWQVMVMGAMTAGGLAACGGAPPGEEGAVAVAVAAAAPAASCGGGGRTLAGDTRFYVRPPDSAATDQIVGLLRSRQLGDAGRLTAMEATPQAVWFTSGTPGDVETGVRATMRAAERARQVPVLVAYDVPFRDCAGYSAGGAS